MGRQEIDVCVVGAGPAGLTAAIEAARYNLSVALVDSSIMPGGQTDQTDSPVFWAGITGPVCVGLPLRRNCMKKHWTLVSDAGLIQKCMQSPVAL